MGRRKSPEHSKRCMTEKLLSGDPECPACGDRPTSPPKKPGKLQVWKDAIEGENGSRVHVVMVGERLVAIVRNEIQADITARQLRDIIKEARAEGSKGGKRG